jgi:hypothetical protein
MRVILTKDNLAKQNCMVASKKCVLCHHDETIKHLFFHSCFARSVWSVIQLASTLYPPCSVANILGNWLHGTGHRFRKHIRVGVIAVIWSMWICRYDKVFNDKNSYILQVIYRCTNTLCLWSSLQHVENWDLFMEVVHGWRLRQIFFQHGWPHK